MTGGAGFLGSYMVETLREGGCPEVFVLREAEYDLAQMANVRRMYYETTYEKVTANEAARCQWGVDANLCSGAMEKYGNR